MRVIFARVLSGLAESLLEYHFAVQDEIPDDDADLGKGLDDHRRDSASGQQRNHRSRKCKIEDEQQGVQNRAAYHIA